MALHALQLTIKAGSWRLFAARKSDPAFEAFSKKVWRRDVYTCQYCGFQAKQYQEVVNVDGNYRNNKLANMVTACVFCTQSLFLEVAGKTDYGGGTLIYLPELTQNELNGLCHVLFCAIANATSYRPDAQNIYRNLKLRSKLVEKELGEGVTHPARLGQILIDANLKGRKQLQARVLKNLRLLPSRTKFKEQIRAWAEAAVEEMKAQEEAKEQTKAQ